ncbi:recombinase [Clostridia bacterium]|nr:recombinase [Clostridia bacterium]
MALQQEKITALYERLSDADKLAGDSMSIQNQKLILEKYANEHGFGNIRHFSDDGLSGTVFSRPGLDAMLAEVKAGNVAVVIIKDQSRIGRDVLEVGLLKRTFEENNVRFIAATDNLDTANGFDMMSIIRDVFNEFYVADCSKKQRAVKRARAEQGIAMHRPPYGYKALADDHNVWLIDESAAEIIREVFKRFVGGEGSYTIAKSLHERGVPSPRTHIWKLNGKPITKEFYWTTTSITTLLDNETYLGTLIQQRKSTPSYKNHKAFIRPKEEWVVTESHHPQLIEQEIFDIVQRLRENRRRNTRHGYTTPLSGLLYCKDCGKTLTYLEQKTFRGYVCSGYRSLGSADYAIARKCTRHYINLKDITAIVLEKIQETVSLATDNADEFARRVHSKSNREAEKTLRSKNTELGKAERRIAELDTIISRIYEDKVIGALSEERFAKMLKGYEAEQKALTDTAAGLKAEIDELKSKTANIASFMKLVAECSEITELTEKVARTFIERVVVHEAKVKEGRKFSRESQEVEIYFTYIGSFE